MRAITEAALKIEELAYDLGNIAHDDKKAVDDYTDEEIMAEARYVLDQFVNPIGGHINHEALCGDDGPEQRKWAQGQVRKLKNFIKKFA